MITLVTEHTAPSLRLCSLIDLHTSKPLISLVPITCTTYYFKDRGIVISPPLLFAQPITNFVRNRCRSAHAHTIQYSLSPDSKTIPDRASVHTQER